MGGTITTDAGGDADCATQCGATCCTSKELCLDPAGAGSCVDDLGPCTDSSECQNDSKCEAAVGRCIPFEPGEKNDECTNPREPGIFRVEKQCEWSGPPAGDPYPNSAEVSTNPLVINFGIEPNSKPSIVFVSSGSSGTAIRIIDGATCSQQFTMGSPAVKSDSTLAVGDITGDGKPEVIGHVTAGGVAAWTYDASQSDFRLLWQTTDTTPTKVHSIALADFTGDGNPEVIAGGVVYDATGQLLGSVGNQGEALCGGGYIAPPVVVDVDHDNQLELVMGASIWTWDAGSSALVPEPYFTAQGGVGFTAVGDFGDFPGAAGDQPGLPEVVVMSPGSVRIQSIGGDVVFGPLSLPGGGDGGNVTIADFDGDDAAEFGVVGSTQYVVYDPACGDATRPGTCASARTDGILWQQTIRENSCAIMGSTVFDFEGDGAAEVVYGDECYLRVMSGADGSVVWSHPRSSATWYEAPIVADVDGDFVAELVTPASPYNGGGCGSTDPVFEGIRCTAQFGCGNAALSCDAGLCRCTQDADCGDPDMGCFDPLAASGGTGKVCRPKFSTWTGLRVYADDRNWVGSRPIWNQHSYSITNVETNGTIPAASAMKRNWETPGLNNFRQNVQDELGDNPSVDITTEGGDFGRECSETNPVLPLKANVCNRGTLGMGKDAKVVFYDGDPNAGGQEVCTANAAAPLAAGDCVEVTCDWANPPLDTSITVHISADSDDDTLECLESNNTGTLIVQCPPPIDVPS